MATPGFIQRMADLGLRFPEAEIDSFESFVADLERAATFVREIDRSFAEEPSHVFNPGSGT